MKHADLLPLLLPPVSYDPQGTNITAIMIAEGKALDQAQSSAGRVRDAVTPFGAGELLTGWERVCGLASAGASYQQRLERVIAKLRETGGLSIPYFKQLAAGLGYTIEIVEPQPFRAGVNRAGDELRVPETIWIWQVVVQGGTVRAYHFRAGQSAAGERLTAFGDPVIESVIQDLKPAHTFVYFAYQEDAA